MLVIIRDLGTVFPSGGRLGHQGPLLLEVQLWWVYYEVWLPFYCKG